MLIDKLCMVLGLTLLNGAVLNEPQRAVDTNNYEVINATDKPFVLYNANADEEQEIDAKTRTIFEKPIDKASRWSVSISKDDYPTKPSNFYYIYNASDYEDPNTITFTESSSYWYSYFDGYEPSVGLQIGQYESLLGKTLYFDNQELINLSTTNIVGQTHQINILDGYSAKIYKEDGTWTPTLTNITAYITATPHGFMNFVELTTSINGINTVLAANIDPRTMNNNEVNPLPYMIFWNGYTNKLSFQSGHKTIKYGDLNGDYPYCFTPTATPYKGEQGEYTDKGDGWTALEVGIDLVAQSFEVVSGFFSWVVFPGITLGLLLLFPILVSMFIWMIKLIKKG